MDINFVAKTALVNSPAMKTLTIKSLKNFLGTDMEEELLLCPVRALKMYLKRTKTLRAGKKCLFVSFKAGFVQDISKNTISHWIKKVIWGAYKDCNEESCKLLRIKAHDVRSLAASWAGYSNASTEAIMETCSWKAHNTFTSFYLKDLSRIRDEMICLGPIVAALHTA